MRQKVFVGILLLIFAAGVAFLINQKLYNNTAKKSATGTAPASKIPTKQKLPFELTTTQADWGIIDNRILESDQKMLSAQIAVNNLITAFGSWGVFNKDGVMLPGKEPLLLLPNNQLTQSQASSKVTVKKMVIELTNRPQNFMVTLDKNKVVTSAIGQDYNPNNQTITVKLYAAPLILDNSATRDDKFTQHLNLITIAQIYRLTHPTLTEEEALKFSKKFTAEDLQGENIFILASKH